MKNQWPLSYRWARANGLGKLVPWHFIEDDRGKQADEAFARESPEPIKVRTFAQRQDCDDCAAFIVEDNTITDEVIYFHPSYGTQTNQHMINSRFPDFWTFLSKVVIPDTCDWISEDNLDNLNP